LEIKLIAPVLVRNELLALPILIVAFGWIYSDRTTRLHDESQIELSKPVLIHEDSDVDQFLAILESDTTEVDLPTMRWAAIELGIETFRAGRYDFKEPVSRFDLLTKINRGEQDPVHLRVPTAVFRANLATRLSNQMRFTAAEFDSVSRDSAFLASMEVQQHHLVGRMLPDTYQFYWTASAEDVIRRIHATFVERVQKRYQTRLDSLGWTVDEATTMASIIEWEVRHADEMARVSGLYWNRINRRMPLQADPTVNYAVGERRRLFHSDYRFEHPYNTYRFRGLPPGPLNNPRLIAIEAALYPESHNYIYMVANSEGYHTFTRTYAEHLRESRKWVIWLNEQVRMRQERQRIQDQLTAPAAAR